VIAAESPLRAFIELRGLLLVRRFLSRRGLPELVARVVVFAITGFLALLFAGAVAAGTWRGVRLGRGLEAEMGITAVFFGIWQTWTAVALTLAERDTLDLRRFLGYPLPPGRVYAYGLAASAAGDPFALFWCVLLAGAFAGAAAGRPGAWLLLFAAALALFVAATVAYVALLQELLGRLTRIRRAREIAIAVAYMLLVLLVVVVATGGKRPFGEVLRTLARVQWVAWPAALAADAGRKLFLGHSAAALPPLLALGAGGAIAGWLSFRLALRDALSGGEGGGRRGGGSAVRGGLPLGWFGAGRAPLLEKELWYLLRHPLSLVMALVIPAIAALVAWKAVPSLQHALEVGRFSVEATDLLLALPLFGFALYAHMVTQPFWLNAFGWDRAGARLLFLAPVRMEDVLAAKNLGAFLLSLTVFGGCALATVAVGGPPPAWVLVGAFVLHAAITPWLYAAGNVVAAMNPIGAGFTLERGSRLPMLSALAGMAATSVVVGLFSLPVLAALKLEQGWLLAPSWALLGIAGLSGWRAALGPVARLTERRREVILDAVCAEDE
jgi:ABC-2 type transport system permease protein